MKAENKVNKKSERLKFEEELAAEVRQDYEERLSERSLFESQWQLNANFVAGNQNCIINVSGEIEDAEKEYYWQEREVFNHIASIVESRLSKLSRVRPKAAVRPASPDDSDIKMAKTATKILESASNKLRLDEAYQKATMWSEITGTAFYKIVWDKNGGKTVGKNKDSVVKEGEVRIDVCPPFEILPDSLTAGSVDECNSIIHAKALHVDDIYRLWGKKVGADRSEVISLNKLTITGGGGTLSAMAGSGRTQIKNHALVIERYTLPSEEMPDGELVIVAGGEVLYYGILPYINGDDGERGLPFVRQSSIDKAGCFYGTSMVERTIPVQRAYNAVKNRKHEFLNRIASGVIAVEDGSVDIDNLAEEGLSPGKVLVYRQGAAPPKIFNAGSVPADFTLEEQRLLSEFVDISGISEIMRSSSVPSTVTSGVAIQMLIEQDDTRISLSAESIRSAVKRIAGQILRLYKQFASRPRLTRFVGSGGEVEVLSFSAGDIGSDEIYFETNNEINSTAASRQAVMYDLLRAGLLYDENGKLDDNMRFKILDSFGYGGWENTQYEKTLHLKRAEKENTDCGKAELKVLEIDQHDLHINQHTKYMLSSEFIEACKKSPPLEEKMLQHIRQHRMFDKAAQDLEGEK